MTTSSGNFVFDNSTLANFKSWAQAISNAFSTFGWTQTTDTGQVNWGTIGAVPSGFVYEIWKASDTLAATLPIFVKVEYGASTTSVQLRFTVGTSSNGTGTITGQTVSAAPWAAIGFNTNQGATLFPCFFSGTTGEFRMWMWASTTAGVPIGALFVIERSKDSSGNNTADYFTAVITNQNSSSQCCQQSITLSGAGNRETGIITPTLTSNSNTGSALGTVAAFPVFPVLGKVGNPMLGLMSVVSSDAAPNGTVTVASMYGSTHTFIVTAGNATPGQMSNAFGFRNAAGTNVSGLMRFE